MVQKTLAGFLFLFAVLLLFYLLLYYFVEKCKVFVALLSPNYINSKVCQEEFNLALAFHRDCSFKTVLIPVAIETMKVLPPWCSDLPCFDFTQYPDEWDVPTGALVKTAATLIGMFSSL